MSKSLGNYIGIDEAPSEIFGKVMSIPDSALAQYFMLCTEDSPYSIEQLLHNPFVAKQSLAVKIITQYWGWQKANAALDAFVKQFSKREAPDEMPEVLLPAGAMPVIELLRGAFDISGGEARRMVGQNAVSIDGEKVSDALATIEVRDGLVLKMGKRRWARIGVRESGIADR